MKKILNLLMKQILNIFMFKRKKYNLTKKKYSLQFGKLLLTRFKQKEKSCTCKTS